MIGKNKTSRTPLDYLALVVAAFACVAGTPAVAGVTVVAVPVQTQIVASCTINSVPSFSFGSILAPTNATIVTGDVQLTCVPGTAWSMTIGQGNNFGTTLNMKRTGGSELLAYQMCGDSNCMTALTQSSGPAGTGTGSIQAQTIAARLISGQSVWVGSYVDSVVLTVSF
jgi:spore coat protein U-like protein